MFSFSHALMFSFSHAMAYINTRDSSVPLKLKIHLTYPNRFSFMHMIKYHLGIILLFYYNG